MTDAADEWRAFRKDERAAFKRWRARQSGRIVPAPNSHEPTRTPAPSYGHPPRVIPRLRGGWLVVSANDDALKIGVTAETESEARALFAETYKRIVEDISASPNLEGSQ